MAMRCQEASERISLAADKRLTPEEMIELEEHIESCEQCQQARRTMAAVDAWLADARLVEPPTSMTAQVMQRVRAHKQRRALLLAWARRAMWVVILAATATLAAIVLISARDTLSAESTVYTSLLHNLVALLQLGSTLARGMQVIASAFVGQVNVALMAMYATLAVAVGVVWMRMFARGALGTTRANGN